MGRSMSHHKPYPAYKDSGVEWIGKIPDHWETLHIKRGALLRNEGSREYLTSLL